MIINENLETDYTEAILPFKKVKKTKKSNDFFG